MASDWVELVNMSLSKIGAKNVTTASLAALSSKEDRLCTQFYAKYRDRLQDKYTWNFAKKATPLNRTDLFETATGYDDYVTITNIATSNPVVVTGTNSYSTGMVVYISSVVGTTELNDTIFEVIATSGTNFSLLGVDGYKYGTYSSGGQAIRVEAMIRYRDGYTYVIPTDFKRAIALDSGNYYEILETRLVTNDEDPVLIYVKNVTDTTLFSDLYEECLEDLIAASLAIPLLGAKEGSIVRRTMEAIYRQSLAEAVKKECQEIFKDYTYNDPWVTARL